MPITLLASDGVNYATWAQQIVIELQADGMSTCLTNSDAPHDEQARGRILKSIDSSLWPRYTQLPSASVLWTTLASDFALVTPKFNAID